MIAPVRDEGAAVPIDHLLAGDLRLGLVGVERIVDDNRVAATARQRSADRGRVTAPSPGGNELLSGFLFPLRPGEELRVPSRFDDLPELAMKLRGEVARITSDDEATGRIVTQRPGDISDRNADRFQGSRRLID